MITLRAVASPRHALRPTVDFAVPRWIGSLAQGSEFLERVKAVPVSTRKGGTMSKLSVALLVTSALICGMTASNAGGAASSPPASCQGRVTSDQASHGLFNGGVVADYLHS